MLAKVGIIAKIENVEWAQWLSGAFKGNFDLTIINHVEPLDYVQYANPQYYWGYDSKAFNDLVKKRAEAGRGRPQQALYVEIQRMLAADAVNAFLFNPSQVSVARRGLKGLWSSSPVFANDLSQVSWQ
jgi:peptide/nickel transport system substrate-binding protein